MDEKTIPTYDSEGRRIRNYSLSSVEHFLSLSLVTVERNRRGAIVCAFFRPLSGASPVRKSAHMGQLYSYLQHLPSGSRAWRHSPIFDGDRGEAIRDVFLAVPLSILHRAKNEPIEIKPPRTSARPAPRPLEFDSEMRCAAA